MSDLSDEAISVRQAADLIHDKQDMEAVYDRLAREITSVIVDKNPVILPVMIGGIYLCGQLLPRFDFPLEVDYLHATRYRDQLQGEHLQWLRDPADKIRGRTVLVVDDILDKGLTLDGIIQGLIRAGAAEILTVVLAAKDCKRETEVSVDFTGVDVPDRYVFGCGMDYRGYWRNLPGIYAVKNS